MSFLTDKERQTLKEVFMAIVVSESRSYDSADKALAGQALAALDNAEAQQRQADAQKYLASVADRYSWGSST